MNRKNETVRSVVLGTVRRQPLLCTALVLAVAEWVSLPPSKTDKGDASGKPYDGFWRRTLTGPRSLARHWDQVCLQMADDPHGRRLLAGHGILADKGETAQPSSAESTPKVPNYGIPDNLDRRVWKLLDPYDFDAGNDGFEAPRTLRRLLKRVPANDADCLLYTSPSPRDS